jgi:hypothetical protein
LLGSGGTSGLKTDAAFARVRRASSLPCEMAKENLNEQSS